MTRARAQVFCLRAGAHSVCLSVGLGRGASMLHASASLKVVGWERNSRGKLAPRKVKDIRAGMSAETLARDAAALNLQLMKWRMLPGLRLDVLGATKCLLVGAGQDSQYGQRDQYCRALTHAPP